MLATSEDSKKTERIRRITRLEPVKNRSLCRQQLFRPNVKHSGDVSFFVAVLQQCGRRTPAIYVRRKYRQNTKRKLGFKLARVVRPEQKRRIRTHGLLGRLT